MNIYIAGVSGDTQYVKSLRSFYEIKLRPGDLKQERASGRGDVARMLAGDEFFERKEFDAIAMFDLDMLHPPDIIEKLRAHDLDMVTGHYYARNSRNVHSIIWNCGNGKWPFVPMIDVPRTGLHEVAITGMGCVLIKREVFEAVYRYLPPGDHPFSIGAAPEVTRDHRILGTDFRFFSIAKLLGYKLWLDADIECRHATVFWLNHKLADKMYDSTETAERLDSIAEQIEREEGMNSKYLEVRIQKLAKQIESFQEQRAKSQKNIDFFDRQLNALAAVKSEDEFLLLEMNKGEPFPVVPEAQRDAVVENRTGLADVSKEEAQKAREHVLKEEAQGFVDDIQTVRSAG